MADRLVTSDYENENPHTSSSSSSSQRLSRSGSKNNSGRSVRVSVADDYGSVSPNNDVPPAKDGRRRRYDMIRCLFCSSVIIEFCCFIFIILIFLNLFNVFVCLFLCM